jgi:hypothetical protein
MKVILNQTTERGEVAIGRAANGTFHIVWCGESLATADTLGGALIRASKGPLKRPSDGTDVSALRISGATSDWFLPCAAAVLGPTSCSTRAG